MGVGCQLYSPATFLSPEKTRYPFHGGLGGPRVLFGRAQKILPTQGFDLRNFQPVLSRYTD